MNRSIFLALIGAALFIFREPLRAKLTALMEKTAAASDEVRRTIEREEGRRNYAYQDTSGIWTFGVGHRIQQHEMNALRAYTKENPAPDALVNSIFDRDVAWAKGAIMQLKLPKPLNANQFAALVSLYFNVGPQLFRNKDGSRTGIWKALTSGDYNKAADEMLRWKRSGNDPEVLLARREREREQFLA